MPKPRARCATSWPMRPKPRIPSVFSYSSTPENFERSHLPAVSDAYACGTLRASASSSAIVCSAAVTTFDSRGVRDHDPALGRRLDVDVVDAHARAADRPQARRALDQLGGHLRRRADQDAVVVADALCQLLVAPVEPQVDVEVLAQQLDARVADLLLDEHLRTRRQPASALMSRASRRPSRCRRSAPARRRCRSPGTSPIRSWLRPSLRYGSTSTMPFARSVDATAAASTASSKSIVPTTSERFAGSATNGVVYEVRSAQPYRCSEDARVRATHQSRPPPSSIQPIWSASRNSVATAGVL